MRFFVNFCETHYNHTPRCALCGCYLGGPGAGHLQSRNHFKRLEQFQIHDDEVFLNGTINGKL